MTYNPTPLTTIPIQKKKTINQYVIFCLSFIQIWYVNKGSICFNFHGHTKSSITFKKMNRNFALVNGTTNDSISIAGNLLSFPSASLFWSVHKLTC